MHRIPFNRPFMTGQELPFISQAHANAHLSGDGDFTQRCHDWLVRNTGTRAALLTHSCTAALEMSAILANVRAGDEIILPSFTFVSTASAFALRGAIPVFVDCRTDTGNIDENLVEGAITGRTKAIVPVHYAGVSCNMDSILEIARRHDLLVIEDAAQGIMSTYKGRQLGTIGHLGAYSFHETKNVSSGEGGALLVNDARFVERAEIVREKGTNRSKFFRGEVDAYTWVDLGSSYLPAEVTAAFLLAQMHQAKSITERRLTIWTHYHALLAQAEAEGLLRRPIVPDECEHNAHMYQILLPSMAIRTRLIRWLKARGIEAVSHYVPLHSSPAGLRLGRTHGQMTHTVAMATRLLRLPMWIGVEEHQDEIVNTIISCLSSRAERVA